MEFKNLTDTEKIPALGLGTWGMGGGSMRQDRSNDKKYIDAIRYAIENGMTHIDTAEIYARGHSEEIIGEAIKHFQRKNIFLTSKLFPIHMTFKGIISACEGSLKRLNADYLDLYLVHWPNPLTSLKITMTAFDQLVKDGLVRYIGVSNFSIKQIQNAQKYSKNKIVTNQVQYSLLHQSPKTSLLPYLQKEKIILTAYSPLGHGDLIKNSYMALGSLAKKYNKTTVQVALRWLMDQDQVIAIPKASSKEHIDEILGSLGWKLTKEDQKFLSTP